MNQAAISYDEFLRAKVLALPDMGIEVDDAEINPLLKPHQCAIVKWALRRGRAAIFAAFGLGKTVIQLEILRLLCLKLGGRGLIVAPLGVRQEFMRDAAMLGIDLRFIRSIDECDPRGLYITNYETVRDGKLDPRDFDAVSLDEAACFPPDAKIETPNGFVAFNSLRIGDNILNASGIDKVRDISRTRISGAVRVTSDGKSILSSDNHPYLTTRGWVAAAELRPGDSLVETSASMRILRGDDSSAPISGSPEAFLQRILLSELESEPTGDHREDAGDQDFSASVERESRCEMATASHVRGLRCDVLPQIQFGAEAEILREPLLCEVANESPRSPEHHGQRVPHSRGEAEAGNCDQSILGCGYAGSGQAEGSSSQLGTEPVAVIVREDEEHDADAGDPSEMVGRQGQRIDEATEDVAQHTRGGLVGRVSSGDQAAPQGSSELSLSRSGESAADDRNRSGWRDAQDEDLAGARPEEDGIPGLARVDRVEILELSDPRLDQYRDADGGIYFYDLTATRHPSFSVDGYLVHNCLRGFGGTKTFRQMMGYFEGSGKYRFVATATPSPNDFIELLAYSAFLDVMDVSAAKTKFFKRNSEHADELTLMPSRERDFWLWCTQWAVFLQRPSDLGYSDEGYELPEMSVLWHEIPSNHENAGIDPNGQGRLLRNAAIGLSAAAREKRDSIPARVESMRGLLADDLFSGDQFIVWCDLNDEQKAVDAFMDEIGCKYSSLYGHQDIDEREALMAQWRNRETQAFVSKPIMYGAGVNLQQCAHAIFLGVGYKFFDFIQAIHRIYRFLQTKQVRIDIIYTEAEREIRRELETKWAKHKELVANMTALIRQYGLGATALASHAVRKMDVTRREAYGDSWKLVNNDCVPETGAMDENSVDLVLTSIPFSTQYEYSPSFRDFGHTESNEHFWEQMDFLIPQLFRVLRPGRVAAIHVKDRITPSGMTGMGFQTVYPFSDDCVRAFTAHGFGFLARKTIVTDVVRENNQTYRLGWTEQCKDGSRMGAGLPEYLLLFRKPPTDTSNGYADLPVMKNKASYTRSRWQIDAHGFMRSSGNRLLSAEDLVGVPHERIFKMFRADSLANVYDFERHVGLSESLERCQECGHVHIGDRKCGQCACRIAGSRLPATFMLLQPQSWHEDVWTDVARMRTLNLNQQQGNREMHVCPLQFDICDRTITQFSMAGETVFDPFAGIGTVPMRAVLLGRRGLGVELSESYFADAVRYLQQAEQKLATPTLFDLADSEEEKEETPLEDAANW